MTSRSPCAALLALAVALATGASAEGPTESPEALVRLLGPLVGRSFVAPFPGGKMTDTQSFEWMLDGRFVRNVHFVSDGEGENHAPPGQPARVRGVWSEISSDGFVATQLFEENGGWRERFTMRFVPVETSPPAAP